MLELAPCSMKGDLVRITAQLIRMPSTESDLDSKVRSELPRSVALQDYDFERVSFISDSKVARWARRPTPQPTARQIRKLTKPI